MLVPYYGAYRIFFQVSGTQPCPLEATPERSCLHFIFLHGAFVFVYRIISDVLNKKIFLTEHPLLLESIVLIFVFCYQLYLYKRHSLKFAASFLIFSAIILSTYFYPLQTALIALIGHNYLPLIAWYKSCQNKSDLNVFFICSSIYILFSFLIYFSALDSVCKIYYLFLRTIKKIPKILEINLVVNLATHPIIFFIVPMIIMQFKATYLHYVIVAKIFAPVVEAVILFYFYKITFRKAALSAVCANLFSWAVGIYWI